MAKQYRTVSMPTWDK